MPDIIDHLISDHQAFMAMLAQLTAEEPPDDAEAIFDRLDLCLRTHTAFEESSVYPLLTGNPSTRHIAFAAYEEHRQVMALFAALNHRDADAETRVAKMKALSEELSRHIREEERALLPLLRKSVVAIALESLGEDYQGITDRLRDRWQDHRETAGSR